MTFDVNIKPQIDQEAFADANAQLSQLAPGRDRDRLLDKSITLRTVVDLILEEFDVEALNIRRQIIDERIRREKAERHLAQKIEASIVIERGYASERAAMQRAIDARDSLIRDLKRRLRAARKGKR